ncbi:guanylin [Eublepharis macularius]|uniref:Guanylin n=1 Tax=Eublepharis macularius TaxID=481883 RepID=A0AA97KEV9_EUBMA|nr:guanylin [Eublepharis macularius]
MNPFLTVSLCLCALAVLSDGVTVKVGDYSFPLESVKKLKELSAEPAARSSHNAINLCNSPKLTEEFHSICASPKSGPLLRKLGAIAENIEICEICANIACSGC